MPPDFVEAVAVHLDIRFANFEEASKFEMCPLTT